MHKSKMTVNQKEIYYSDYRFDFADSRNGFINGSEFVGGSLKKKGCHKKNQSVNGRGLSNYPSRTTA